MQRSFKFLLPALVIAMVALMPVEAAAQAEFTPFVGYLVGSGIDPKAPDGTEAGGDRSFANSFTWGARGGYTMRDAQNFAIEGSFTQAPFANFSINGTELDARATYGDLNAVIQSTGTARFYGTAGLGLVRFRMGASEGGQTHTKLGVNFGVGVKLPMWENSGGRWGFRFDFRDHWLRMDADDSMRSGFRDQLELPANSSSSRSFSRT